MSILSFFFGREKKSPGRVLDIKQFVTDCRGSIVRTGKDYVLGADFLFLSNGVKVTIGSQFDACFVVIGEQSIKIDAEGCVSMFDPRVSISPADVKVAAKYIWQLFEPKAHDSVFGQYCYSLKRAFEVNCKGLRSKSGTVLEPAYQK
jgi:hypothetical protein